jgi:hypothetical protein
MSANPRPVPEIETWAIEYIRSFENEVVQPGDPVHTCIRFENFEAGQEITQYSPAEQGEIAVAALVRLQQLYDQLDAGSYYLVSGMLGYEGLNMLALLMLRQSLPFTENRLAAVIGYCTQILIDDNNAPLEPILRQVERVVPKGAASPALAASMASLSELAAKSRVVRSSLRGKISKLAERLAGGDRYTAGLAASPWREKIFATFGAASGEAVRTARCALEHATKAIGKSKPNKAFLKTAHSLLAEDPELAKRIAEWIEAYVPNPTFPDANEDAIRGLIWMLSAADGQQVASRIGKYCELCFKKVPDVGPGSTKLGNGAVHTLGLLGGMHAVAELTRLKSKVRYATAVARIETTLAELASQLGITGEELQEIALPTFGLSPIGERQFPIGKEGFAILRIAGTREVRMTWTRSGGREMATVPKALRETAPEDVATARTLKKEIEGALAGQCARIEGLYLSNRRIPIDHWRERYLLHPLLSHLTRRLIWRFEWAEKSVAGLPRDDIIEDVAGQPMEQLAGSTVTLWHPIQAEANHVLDWRRRLATLGLTQPFKQVHREIYVVTDAERQTEVYSNRFAAHILRQHQFKALCDQRGWLYGLMGAWDSHNTPMRRVPSQRLSVEFWVDMMEDAETTDSGVYTEISTDQVRFIDENLTVIPVADVPPLVFSELMRDVDLFVGVASIGNDPDWRDGGREGRYQTYWDDYAFGALSETGKTRAEVIAELLPQLAITEQCAVEDRFLVVRGKLRTYRIHLGSGNIRMDPNNQYLCIVPGRDPADRSKSSESLVLPFEGDHMLSVILSKAFLLAADDEITDKTILYQIKET